MILNINYSGTKPPDVFFLCLYDCLQLLQVMINDS